MPAWLAAVLRESSTASGLGGRGTRGKLRVNLKSVPSAASGLGGRGARGLLLDILEAHP
jgi:hypothetical protein